MLRTLFLQAPGKDQVGLREEQTIVRAGHNSRIGRLINRKSVIGIKLGKNDYLTVVTGLMDLLAREGLVSRVDLEKDLQGWRLSPSAVRVVPGEAIRSGTAQGNRYFHDLYNEIAADLKAGAYALQSLARIGLPEAVTALVLGVAAIWLVGSVLTVRRLAGISFAAVLIGLLVTLVAIAARARGWTIPHLALGAALENHLSLNMTLVVNRLADVDALTPMTSPFLQLSMRNFAGLLLAIALGVVAAPHLLGRHVSQAVVAPGGAVRRTALALIGVAVVAASLPPLAVYNRIAFEKVLAKGIEDAVIPQKFADASELGWVKICDRNSRDVAELAASCAKVPEQRWFLRLQDLIFSTDGFVVDVPFMADLDRSLQYPLLFGVLLATLLMGNALLAGLVDLRNHVLRAAVPGPGGPAEVAERSGMSRATAQRYLSHLHEVGRVDIKLRYGSGGRPEHGYRWHGPAR